MRTIDLSVASPADLQALPEIERSVFSYDILKARQLRYLLQSTTAAAIKAVCGQRPVGYMILLRRKNSSVVRIHSPGVVEEAQHTGIGSRFLDSAGRYAALHNLGAMRLEQQMQNMAVLLLFLRAGFSICGRKESHYTDGSSALLLRKCI